MIGNSRLHWGLFINGELNTTWDTEHLQNSPPHPRTPSPPLLIASVVPTQTTKWQNYPNAEFITLDQISLGRIYSTLGIDRALAVFGGGKVYGFPILVIDAGTALTFTGADANQNLIGGAILPGLGLQFSSLGQKTGQLPLLKVGEVQELPPRFALDTKSAIQSGIIYTLLAGIKDFIAHWLLLFPDSKIAITGGDSKLLGSYLKEQFPEIGERIILDKSLIFLGMREIVRVN
ncbi:pantothenate kinase [Okeanomitos corallinicola TIOX110]|uniref:Type III pantothenate kinase n=1 Tax=Okeanomitos corallinicola TIOX110 TaxID=3133117 RepID=A0ABZ2UXW7_9CYAN